ncbi:hypothetical protein [Pseudomonas sp. 2FE]|uniref:hypothetical protein n=1 Tax=Pseudomonas sp. 2FE TaxID=2502190 RepID=UPI0010F4D9D7|nr:hypothetical protein [Pseudomonas sp. 2FE]
MPANTIDKTTLIAIAEEVSLKASKNAGVADQLIFPHLYLVLNKHLRPNGDAVPDAVPEQTSALLMTALQAAQVALDNCVQVMSRDLAGLKLIQPELVCAQEALVKVNAALAQ